MPFILSKIKNKLPNIPHPEDDRDWILDADEKTL